MTYNLKRTVRLGIAAVVSTALLAAGTPAVSAAPIVTGNIAGMSPTTIDTSRVVTLTIVKPVADTSATSQGAVFEVRRLDGFDLADAAGWERIRALTTEEAENLPGETTTAETNPEGKAVLENLKMGVYFIRELPSAITANESYRFAEPFVVFLPVADAKTKQWKYDVTIHPKAQPGIDTQPKPPNEPPPGSSVTVLIPFLPLIPLIVGGFLFGSYSGGAATPPVVTSPTPEPEPPLKKGIPKTEKGIPKTFTGLPQTGSPVLQTLGLGLLIAVLGALLMLHRRRSLRFSSRD